MDEKNTKEINLLDLLNVFVNWLLKYVRIFFQFIGYLIKTTFKYKIVAILFMLTGLGLGIFFSQKKVYKAEAMANFYGVGVPTVKEIAKQLEITNPENRIVSLATKLNIPDSVSRNIVSIQTFSVIDYLKNGTPDKIDFANNHSLTDTLNLVMNDRLYFQIKTFNIAQIPVVQAAIENYFSKNQVLNTDFQNARNELTEKIKICDVELKRIDSLAKVSYFKDANQQVNLDNNKLLIGEQRKQLFSADLLNLQGLRSSSLAALEVYKKPVQFPSDFVITPAPVNGTMKYSVYGIIFGFIFAVVFSFIADNIKAVFRYLNTK